MCQTLGIPAQRLAPADTPTAPTDAPPPVTVICDRCTHIVARRFRRPSASVHRRMFCRTCGESTAGQLRLDTSSQPHVPPNAAGC